MDKENVILTHEMLDGLGFKKIADNRYEVKIGEKYLSIHNVKYLHQLKAIVEKLIPNYYGSK